MALRLRGHDQLTPEQALLLACARSTLQTDHVQRIGLAMRQGIDWNRLWSLARRHGVGFFVGKHLLPADTSSTKNGQLTRRIDSEFVRQMKEDLWQETGHALVLREHQLRLNAKLTQRGIQVLWLKGLILTQARFSLLMDSWRDSVRLLAPRLFPPQAHVRSLCPSFWRRAPGLPHIYYYFHSADRLLKRGSL